MSELPVTTSAAIKEVASMEQLIDSSPFYSANAPYIEQLYEEYLRQPNSVSDYWRTQFDQLPRTQDQIKPDMIHSTVQQYFAALAKTKGTAHFQSDLSEMAVTAHDRKQVAVTEMVAAYRVRGHQKANLDPINYMQRHSVPDLTLQHHGLNSADLECVFNTGNLCIGKEQASLSEIVDALESTYCSSIGAEYMHIVNTSEKRWIQQRMESVRSHPSLSQTVKRSLLEQVSAAEGLEKSLASKFPGYKRFGLEGGESLIPMINEAIMLSGGHGVKEVVIGMAHRGRLNVLVNIFGKNPSELFDEFAGKKQLALTGSGDVKYHQGFSSNVVTKGGEVHLALAFNPSHLEIVSPVVQGSVRARQDRRQDVSGDQVLPIIVHGDAAFAGQGVVMETFQMSQTRGYKTGGTLHIIINNQVGFTTSRLEDARSTEYCTDIAKMVQSPIFHVNGDDPEAVLFVTQMAIDFRREFKKDIVIDMICYRRHGHNETDEPSGTQPIMYSLIRSHPSTRTIYAERLVAEKVLSATEADELASEYRKRLDNGEPVVKSLVKEPNTALFVDWTPYLYHHWTASAETQVDLKSLQSLAKRMEYLPQGFVLQKQVEKIIQDRKKMTVGSLPVNWGFAETMAYATLLAEGYPVRLTGQDCGRGTFSHRHAVYYNQKDATPFAPLSIAAEEGNARFDIFDSFLSEEAVLGFEYGYATTAPKGVVIWEAQFGDFANGAQVVIDQFISSGEHKWARLCGLTLLLPHGYEGQGPEHSSARLERFLQLCAEHNMQVCVPSTPAQIFHMIRRQAIRPLRKPLIVMSPKSLLRHKQCVSTLEELAEGTFQTVLPELQVMNNKAVEKVILCSGRLYYDLLEKRTKVGESSEGRKDAAVPQEVAIVRIEQLYPFPEGELFSILKATYPALSKLVWCQEEPKNQGAWYCLKHHLENVVGLLNKELAKQKEKQLEISLYYAGRAPSAAPACGYVSMHVEQQQALVEEAFTV